MRPTRLTKPEHSRFLPSPRPLQNGLDLILAHMPRSVWSTWSHEMSWTLGLVGALVGDPFTQASGRPSKPDSHKGLCGPVGSPREAREGSPGEAVEANPGAFLNREKVVTSVVWCAGWESALSVQDSVFPPVICRGWPFEGGQL